MSYKISSFPDREALIGGEYIPLAFGSNYKTTVQSVADYAFPVVAQKFALPSGSSLMGTIADGDGAVARTQQDKNRDFVNIRDYGGASGSTSDIMAANALALSKAAAILHQRGGGVLWLGGVIYLPAGVINLSAFANVCIAGGMLVGVPVAAHGQPTTILKLWGTLGAPVALPAVVSPGVRDFSVTNTFAAGDLLLISNFPTDATDAYTEGAADALGRRARFYANSSTANRRQTRRKELLRVRAATGTSVSTSNPTVHSYASTQALQLQKVNPSQNWRFDCDLTNILVDNMYAEGFSATGNMRDTTIVHVTSWKPLIAPPMFESSSTDCRIDCYGATFLPQIRGAFTGLDGPSDNGLVKLLGCVLVNVDVSIGGATSLTGFAHGVMIDTEFVEAQDGYCSLPAVGGQIDVAGEGANGDIVFIACDPYAAKATGISVNVSAPGGQVHIKGAENITVSGPMNTLYLEGAWYISVDDSAPSPTLFEGQIANPRDVTQIRVNLDIRGLWRNATLSLSGATFIGFTSAGRYIRRGNLVFLEGSFSVTSSSAPTDNIRINGLPFSARNLLPYPAVFFANFSGFPLTATVATLSGTVLPGSQSIVPYVNGAQQFQPPAGAFGAYFAVTYEVDG